MKLQSIRVRNFKAIVDSRVVHLGPLTVFIGNNGVGKSSLVEALQTYQLIVRDGLDFAMQRWRGIEHARHKGQDANLRAGRSTNPIQFDLAIGASARRVRRLHLAFNNDPAGNRMMITAERVSESNGISIERDAGGAHQAYGDGRSILAGALEEFADEARSILAWQFLTMSPEHMGAPGSQQ